MNEAAELKMARAYTTLIAAHPFFATLLLRLQRAEDPQAKTMWVDGHTIGYNPEYILTLSHDDLVGSLAHGVMHVASLHPWRKGVRSGGPWDFACDQVVNQIVTDAGLRLPEGAVPGVADKSAEELYVHIKEDCEDSLEGDQSGGTCDVRAPKGDGGRDLSEAEAEHQMNEAKINVSQAAHAARQAGRMPAGLERFAEKLLEPRVPWKEILARFLDNVAKNDYCFMRPNRRYLSSGIILPSLYSEEYGTVVMGCDTSGSIDQNQLRDICSEVLGVLEGYTEQGHEPELTIAWFDTKVYPQVVSDAADLKPKGGGGTDFAVVMKWVKKTQDMGSVRALIMVTDGYCDTFGEDPGLPVLWILTNPNSSFKPPFGEVAHTINE